MTFDQYIAQKSSLESTVNSIVIKEWRKGAKSEVEIRNNPSLKQLTKLLRNLDTEFFGVEFC